MNRYYRKEFSKIYQAKTIEEVMSLGNVHYSKMEIKRVARIFNECVFLRKVRPDLRISLKGTVNLAYYFMMHQEKKKYSLNKFRMIDYNAEINYFVAIVSQVEKLYSKEQLKQSHPNNEVDMRCFLSYHFDYPSIAVGEYLQLFKLFEKVSLRAYEFSLYNIGLDLLQLTTGARITDKGIVANTGLFKKNYIENIFSIQMIEKLFLREPFPVVKYPTEVPKCVQGKIGIEKTDGYFIPQSLFVFQNLLDGLLRNDYGNKEKGRLLEEHLKEVLLDFFAEGTVYHTLFDAEKNEYDILVEYKNYILLFECKAQSFHEVFREHNKAHSRLVNQFKNSILKGCRQAQRAKIYIMQNEPTCFYDSDKFSKKEMVKIINTMEKEILKVVVTLDDFLNLAESSHLFFEEEEQAYKDTWIVNLLSLKKILWAVDDVEDLIKYIQYRTAGIETISSLHAEELAQFAYYKDTFYNMVPSNGLGIEIILNNFTGLFDEYDCDVLNMEIDKLKSHLQTIECKVK